MPPSASVRTAGELTAAIRDRAVSRIIVSPGSYTFSSSMAEDAALYIDHKVAIEAAEPPSDGSGTVVLNVQDSSNMLVVYIASGADVELIGLDITGGSAKQAGGGVLVDGKAKLNNCRIYQNTAVYGGGLAVSGVATLTDCDIHKNGGGNGGGVVVTGEATFSNCNVVKQGLQPATRR